MSSVRVVHHLDSETSNKLIHASDKLSEFMHVLANEPSIGLYHVSNHVTRNVPRSVELRRQLIESTKSVEEMSYDMDYTLVTIKDLRELNTFSTIKDLLVSSMATVDMINKGIPYKAKPVTETTVAPQLHNSTEVKAEEILSTPEIEIASGGESSGLDSPPGGSYDDGSSLQTDSSGMLITKKKRKGKEGKKKRKDFTMKSFEI